MSPPKKLDAIVKKIEEIPTLPVISDQINLLFRDSEASIKQVEQLVLRDPPMAAKLLKIVNSSFYGLLNKVSSIDHALVILGFKEVKNIVLGFALQKHFNKHSNQFDPERFWMHSIICSQIAKHISKHFNIVDDGTFLLSGLIHDLGKLVIDQYFPDEFSKILQHLSENNSTFSEAEKEIIGVTHYQIAAKLLQQWHFPKKVIMQIFYHHAPWHDKNFTSGSIVLYLSNILTKRCGHSCTEVEHAVSKDDFLNASVINFITKNGFDLDEEIFDHLQLQVGEFLAAEQDKVLNIFG